MVWGCESVGDDVGGGVDGRVSGDGEGIIPLVYMALENKIKISYFFYFWVRIFI